MEELELVARDTDRSIREARARLVHAVRSASAGGMTQHQIAAAIGRSQPEVSRLLRFHETGELALKVRGARSRILELLKNAGGTNVRVFGSLATGAAGPESDVDLLFTMTRPLSLLELSTLELQIADLVGANVDLVPETALRPDLRERALAEAVPL